MKEQFFHLAKRLRDAVSSDTPRQTMQNVASALDRLGEGVKDDDGTRSLALELAASIDGHQYGLRGFGDGSLSRGRDLTQQERMTITKALRAYGTAGVQEKRNG